MTTRNYRTFTAMLQCRHCGGGLPLQGPMRTVQCSACQGNNEISPERFAYYLYYASFENDRGIPGELRLDHPKDGHLCPKCASPIDLRRIPIGAEDSTPCEKCGTPVLSFPPPPWLKEQLPGLVQIYGAERDPADIPASGMPLAVGEEKTKAKPILTACPQCSGNLSVTADSPRTMACTFCGASVFLPEELWRTLHPVKRAIPWSIAYYPMYDSQPNIDLLEHIQEHQATARRQQEEKWKKEKEEELKRQQAPEEIEEDAKRGRKATVAITIILLLGAGLGLLMAFLMW